MLIRLTNSFGLSGFSTKNRRSDAEFAIKRSARKLSPRGPSGRWEGRDANGTQAMIAYHGTTEAFWEAIQAEGVLWGRKDQRNPAGNLMSRVTWFTPYPDFALGWGPVVLAVKFPKTDADEFNREDDWQFTRYDPIPLEFVWRVDVRAPKDDVIEVAEKDCRIDLGTYVDMASGDKMVSVVNESGETILVLGRGKPKPMTEEEKAALDAFTRELFDE